MCSFVFIILSIQMSHFLLRLLPTVSLCKCKQNSSNESEVAQSFPTLWGPVDCSPPGSSVYGILQARILEWVAVSFSRGSSWPRDWTQVSCIAGRRFNLWATREAHNCYQIYTYLFGVQSPRVFQKYFWKTIPLSNKNDWQYLNICLWQTELWMLCVK